ncbi:ABC transporter substrate-binding protein [Gordonia sp. TBRC 11910]|uniref:ABC transporter substrate-binding protein n=1 Tax=Gordonia asplenii TaxID=2725283 RepID=A0A848L151_9ACTN|nr:hypothetical protein [Gordonia asplenii]NMO04192.1 ABC transporter substrate-binding protein [Gordonia asplenii]
MRFAKFVAAAAVLGAVTAVSACGSSDSNDAPLPSTTASSATTTSSTAAASTDGITGINDPNKRPTVAVLNTMLETALNPKVPASERQQLVQGSEKDPQAFAKLDKAVAENKGVTYKIIPPVIPAGPKKATVKVRVKLPDNPVTNVEAGIVFDGGRWKLSNGTVCALMSSGNVKSAMCPSTASTSAKPTS